MIEKFEQLNLNNLKQTQEKSIFSEDVFEFCKKAEETLRIDINFLIEKENFFNKHIELSKTHVFNYQQEISNINGDYITFRGSFISSIVSYVNKAYNVKLDKTKIKERLKKNCPCADKYTWEEKREILKKYVGVRHYSYDILESIGYSIICECPLNSEIVLSEIVKEMKGLSFEEIRLKELKEKLSDILSFNRNSLKNKILSFRGVQLKTGWYERATLDNISLKTIFQSLYHYEHGSFGISSEMEELLKFFEYSGTRIPCYEPITGFNSNVVERLQLYKNNRFDIKFKSHKLAQAFLKEYIIQI